MGFFDAFRKGLRGAAAGVRADRAARKTQDQPESTPHEQHIIPIDRVAYVQLFIEGSDIPDELKERLHQTCMTILHRAWPALFPLISEKNPELKFTLSFVRSFAEMMARVHSASEELSSSIVVQSLNITLGLSEQTARQYVISLALHLRGAHSAAVLVAPNNTLMPAE